MPLSAYKFWIDGEVLTAADLNASFGQLFNNQQSIGSPRTAAYDMDGQELILDADADSSITADTDDRIDFRMQGQDLFKMDGTAAIAVNGLTFGATASGNAPTITAQGSDTNIGVSLVSKGTGSIVAKVNTITVLTVTADSIDLGSAAYFDVSAATGGGASEYWIGRGGLSGGSVGINAPASRGIELDIANTPVVGITASASNVNGVTVNGTATGQPVTITASGTDTDIGVSLIPKGAGAVKLGSSTVTATPTAAAVPVANGSGNLANGWISAASVDQHADLVLLSVASPSAASSVDFDSTVIDTTTYQRFLFTFKLTFSADSEELNLRTDTANGGSVDAGASDYSYAMQVINTTGAENDASTGSSLLTMCDTGAGNGVGNSTNESLVGYVFVTPGDASTFPAAKFEMTYLDATTRTTNLQGSGHRRAVGPINFVRFLPTTGTITGTIRAFGLKAA